MEEIEKYKNVLQFLMCYFIKHLFVDESALDTKLSTSEIELKEIS